MNRRAKPNPASTTQQLRAAWKHRGGPQHRTVKRFSPEKSNSAFDACYRGHVVPEAEWETFIATLRSPLPSTFSFVHTGCASVDPALVQARFEEHCLPQLAITDDGDDAGVLVATGVRVIVRLQCMRSGGARAFLRSEAVAAPRRVRPLPWFPSGRGWQLDAPRKELVALRTTFRALRQFIEAQVGLGRLNRQEAVSMLPPLLLQIRPGDAVLDLCAAPGSKTVLLLSLLAKRAAADADDGALVTRGGCVVANEINPQRCARLRVRLAKCRVPGAVVCCAAAQRMPGADGTYDRVLCDVPCSGDGTLRKNPDIWDSWQPRFSASLHPLQLAILTRGLQLLRPGGLLLYSTCSFSPVEGEAVVAAALRHCDGVELVDVHGALPPLVAARGLERWRVTASEDGSGVGSLDEASEEQRERWRLQPSLFPPTAAELKTLALHRCARVLPHQQDTGGFFVALLRKGDGAVVRVPECAAPLLAAAADESAAPPAEAAELEPALQQLLDAGAGDDDDGEAANAAEAAEPTVSRGGAPEPLAFTAVGDDTAAQLREFYGLDGRFPWPQLLSAFRHTLSRRLYLTSAEGAAAVRTSGLRVLAAGVKVFEVDPSLGVGCPWRVVQEGALLLLPFLGRRLLRVTAATLGALLRARTLPLPVGEDAAAAPADAVSADDAPLLDELAAASPPCSQTAASCSRATTGAAPPAPPSSRKSTPTRRWRS